MNFLNKLFIACILLGLEGASAYSQSLVPENVVIEFDRNVKTNLDNKNYLKLLRLSCQIIGKAIQVGSGPWGVGIFKNYSCVIGSKKILGTPKKSSWNLYITNNEKNLLFQLKNQANILAELKLNATESGFELLQDPEFVDLVSYSLMKQLPYMIKIDRKYFIKSKQELKFRHWKASEANRFKYRVPKPPENIVFYTIQSDAVTGLYRSVLVGEGQVKKVNEPKLEFSRRRKNKKEKVLKGGSVTYSIPPEVLALNNTASLWAHQAEGPQEKDEELHKILQKAAKDLDQHAIDGTLDAFLQGNAGLIASILESAASGYIGFRYGLQVLPVEGQLGRLLDNTSMLNLVAEVRGGPVKGLRYYYDKLPETKIRLEGQNGESMQSSLAFARHVLGFSWEMPVDFFINRLTIDPKIGVWTFNARLPVKQDENGKVVELADFNLGSTASIAIESGLEISRNWFTLRGFYALDGGFSLIKQGAKVTSNRFGAEAFFKAGPQFNLFDIDFKTALLGSFVYEEVKISRGLGDLEAGQSEISSISYSAGYAGGGGAISW